MLRIRNEQELIEAFRPLERETVELPRPLEYPLDIKDYFAWTEGAGHRVFLVLGGAGLKAPLGVVFRRGETSGAGTTVAQMCDWCHAVRAGNEVGLLTAESSARRRVGLNLCRDLSCKEKALSDPGADDFPQPVSPSGRVRRITQRMTDFARRNLF
jgi:hypothetical protein